MNDIEDFEVIQKNGTREVELRAGQLSSEKYCGPSAAARIHSMLRRARNLTKVWNELVLKKLSIYPFFYIRNMLRG